MKILLVVQKPLWPSRDGGAYVTRQLVEGLAERGHQVRVIATHWNHGELRPADSRGDDQPSGAIDQRVVRLSRSRRWLAATAASVLRRQSIVWHRYAANKLERTVAEEMLRESWSALQIDGIQVADSCLRARATVRCAPPVVYRAHNCEADLLSRRMRGWPKAGRILGGWELGRQRLQESRVIRSADAVAAINRQVAEHAESAGARYATVVPAPVARVAGAASSAGAIGFLGSLDWWPNVEGLQWFLDDVLPRVLARLPTAEVQIAGRGAERWPSDHRPRGTVGWKSVEDSREYLAGLGVFVAPVHWTGGQQIKVLEAFSAGLAVVATQASVSGLEGAAGAARVVDDADGFADAVVELAGDEAERRRLAESALRVAAQHERGRVAGELEQLYRRLRTRGT